MDGQTDGWIDGLMDKSVNSKLIKNFGLRCITSYYVMLMHLMTPDVMLL